MSILAWILLVTFIDGLIALVGAFSLLMSNKMLERILLILVAFAAGALLSGAFFHLMVESIETMVSTTAFIYLMSGFIAFFLIEKFLHWHHCHDRKCEIHPFTYLILFGDGVHNFVDGLVIAASFLINVPFGIVTSLLIIGHEIPQELGNFGILVYGGFTKTRALLFNFIAQLTCVLGGLIGFFASGLYNFSFLLPFAAGGFIYIAASDLIPELHKEVSLKKSMFHFAFFMIGILFMFMIKSVFGG
jgi:zinc and cadmium transporter